MAIDRLPRCTRCGYSIRERAYTPDERTPALGRHIECHKKPSRLQLRQVARILDDLEPKRLSAESMAEYGIDRAELGIEDEDDYELSSQDAEAIQDVKAIYAAMTNESERKRMLDLLADYAKLDAVMEWARAERRRISPEYGLRMTLDAFLVESLPRDPGAR